MTSSTTQSGLFARLFGIWDRVTGYVDIISRWFMGAALLGILCMLLLQILIRYVLPFPAPWVEEVAVYLSGYVALIGMSVCLRANYHLEVDLLVQLLPSRLRKLHRVFLMAIVAFFALYLIKYGMKFVELGWGQVSPSSYLYVSHARLAVPIGGVLLLLQSVTMMGRATLEFVDKNSDNDTLPDSDIR
ncbi:MAG: TRAP transporter small permease [Granulosicoccus sp.]